jgi:hydroxyacylglutathione hydrolase
MKNIKRKNLNLKVVPIKSTDLFFKNYNYLIIDDENKTAILIDCSWHFKDIEKYLKNENLKLKAIFITHSHIDHIIGAKTLAKKHNISIFISRRESEYYRLNKVKPIENNEKFVFGNIEITSILTSGHSKGSMCFKVNDNLFTGDTLFIEGCGLCYGNGASVNEMFESLKILKDSIPYNTKIYPGHSYGEEPGKLFSEVLEQNVYLHFTDINMFRNFRMRKSQTKLFNFK